MLWPSCHRRRFPSTIWPRGLKASRTVFDVPAKRTRYAELGTQLQDPDLWRDRERAARVQRDHAALERELKEVTEAASSLQHLQEIVELVKTEPDATLAGELTNGAAQLAERIQALERRVYFSGPHDQQPAIATITAGAGGTDAQDWAGMLLRMYLRYGESKGWRAEVLDESRGAEAGYKHVTVRVDGPFAYGHLKHEAGVHRLVRQSPFNADQLRQTSFALLDVVPEIEPGAVDVRPEDIEFSAFRSSGKGGQNVQKVSTAVRLRHRPTGIVVACQTERSQAQNRERATAMLLSKLEYLREQQHAATIADLRGETPDIEWGHQIRSYVLHPYKQVKDHRTGYESSAVESVLDGALEPLIEASLQAGRSG